MTGMTQGELEARILDGDRAQASAPPDVSRELRLTAQAEAGAWQRSADAKIGHDPARSAGATALARHLVAQREQLEAANACYEKWTAGTGSRREAAGKARAELQRRELAQQTAEGRHAEPEGKRQTMAEWWRQLDTDLAAVDRAIEREHQAAIAAGQAWPPQRTAQAETTHARQVRSSRDCSATGTIRNRTRIRRLPPMNRRRRAQQHSRRSTSPATGRPAWTP